MRRGRGIAGLLGLGAGLALAAAACADEPAGGAGMDGERVSLGDLVKSEWLAEEIQGRAAADGVRSTLGFGPQNIYGSAGCNHFNGKAGEREGVVEFGALATTRRMCEPPVMDQEQRFLSALERVDGFRLDQRQGLLFALDSEGAAILRLSRLDAEG